MQRSKLWFWLDLAGEKQRWQTGYRLTSNAGTPLTTDATPLLTVDAGNTLITSTIAMHVLAIWSILGAGELGIRSEKSRCIITDGNATLPDALRLPCQRG